MDTDFRWHGFSMENTPLENFYGNDTNITINGNSVARNTVAQIIFGNSYQDVTSIGNAFIYDYSELLHADLGVFTNVVSIGDSFFYNADRLVTINLTGFTKVTDIGNTFLGRCYILESVDLSALRSLERLGQSFVLACESLSSIYIGDVDWSKTSVGVTPFNSVPNVSTSTLYADTMDLAAKFKTAMYGRISQWGVVISGIHLTPQAVEDITAGGTTFMVNLASLLPWFTDGYSDIGGLHPGLPD
jgi:hypothetical protein